jgi:3-hydroxyisobutyrate dehydrogenase-like beta-hydroxyacid dehydrogenase
VTTIGLINPGAMGASVGAAARHNKTQVIWASAGRSASTKERADKAQLDDCGSLQNLVTRSDIILSICPPHTAMAVAIEVADLGFTGLYLEGNAIAPDHTRRIESVITKQGAEIIDGGIIGGPAWKAESATQLYLSGEKAQVIADIFAGSNLQASVISNQIGAASALKMTFAAFTKGSTALLSAILAVAEKEGVRSNLEAQWGDAFTRQTHQRVIGNTAKAWRFEGEMQEIAATFSAAGVPPGFHEAAAQVFSSLAEYKDQQGAPTIEEVLATLLSPSAPGK